MKDIIFPSKFLNGQPNGISVDAKQFHDFFETNSYSILMLRDLDTPNKDRPLRSKIMIHLKNYYIILKGVDIRNIKAEFFFFPQVSPIRYKFNPETRIVYRIHDVFPITNPQWFSIKAILSFRISMYRIKKDSLFIFNSEYTKKQFLTKKSIREDQNLVVHCMISNLLNKKCKKCQGCKTSTDSNGYLLCVGTIEPRKNYQTLLDIYTKNLDSLPNLVVIGNQGWKQKRIAKGLQNNPKISLMGGICDGALMELYVNSIAFVSLSLDEGFNIPAHEAERYELPMILSDIPVHREFFQSSSLVKFVSPRDQEEIVNQIMQFNTYKRKSQILNYSDSPMYSESLNNFLKVKNYE